MKEENLGQGVDNKCPEPNMKAVISDLIIDERGSSPHIIDIYKIICGYRLEG